ncbi:hypothetical protein [Streptomyces sp. NPDC012746]|uniref:hypothetical protein n=1 Tax=Streptomyces sp. NPDC012746 TaxID=3364845 RepID=UPI0036BCA73E
MKRHTTAALIVAVGLLAAGCSSSEGGTKDEGKADPTAAVLKVARTYQEAKNADDWRTACGMSSERQRYGTVEECVESNTRHSPSPTPSSSSPSASASPSPSPSPPRYADGSTPHPQESRTTGGPERADLGPVVASDVVEAPAAGEHPAGYGVLVTYTVQWPGKPSTKTLHALRLIQESGAWVVDQHERISESDASQGSPVLTALSGG